MTPEARHLARQKRKRIQDEAAFQIARMGVRLSAPLMVQMEAQAQEMERKLKQGPLTPKNTPSV